MHWKYGLTLGQSASFSYMHFLFRASQLVRKRYCSFSIHLWPIQLFLLCDIWFGSWSPDNVWCWKIVTHFWLISRYWKQDDILYRLALICLLSLKLKLLTAVCLTSSKWIFHTVLGTSLHSIKTYWCLAFPLRW